jgi:precorrin-3B synthase
MNEALRKGWCPGALRPMQARDGLLVRLRMTGGIVPAVTAHALADMAARYGNGLLDLSARANLQMRGVTAHTLFKIQNALHDLHLLDTDPAAESVRNVVASPLAGLGDGLDIRPLVAALESRLAGSERLHALPGKFGFVVDDGGSPSLAGVSADVRFDWDNGVGGFALGLGGTAAQAQRIGHCTPDALVDHAVRVAEGALALFARSRTARRMRGLIQEFGIDEVAAACGGEALKTHAGTQADSSIFSLGTGVLPLAVPFGRLDHGMLRAAATLAETTASREIRLTPFRALLIPGLPEASVDTDALRDRGFIVDVSDDRLAVAACAGREGCTSGTTSTHADARALSDIAAALGHAGTPLHVSGCQKGCAKASASAITLVGHDGRYDLVRDGRASDFPIRRGLDLSGVRDAIAAIVGRP